jgi:hypothetical protein
MESPVYLPKSSVHFRPSVLAELTMEDYGSFLVHESFYSILVLEKSLFKLLGSIDINGLINVPTLEFVIESTVYDQEWLAPC